MLSNLTEGKSQRGLFILSIDVLSNWLSQRESDVQHHSGFVSSPDWDDT